MVAEVARERQPLHILDHGIQLVTMDHQHPPAVCKTMDGALIAMTYHCLRAGSAEIFAKLDRGEAIDPATYYFRFTALFETSAPEYGWLNRIVAVGIGERLADGPHYNVFEIL